MYCISYVIRKGDTLYKLSRQFNVSINAIMEANPMVNVYNLMAGTLLCIPVSVPSDNVSGSTEYQVQDGDTLGSVLDRSGVNLANFMQLNGMNEIELLPGSTLKMPVTGEEEGKKPL